MHTPDPSGTRDVLVSCDLENVPAFNQLFCAITVSTFAWRIFFVLKCVQERLNHSVKTKADGPV
jgi:hypothetical protein